jgi:hypothetical protein
MRLAQDANRCRFDFAGGEGHYESYFLRANHPQRALAFWIRYTFFRPDKKPDDAVGEVWAIWFDGEAQRVAATKQVFPLTECSAGEGPMAIAIGASRLDRGSMSGNADTTAWRMEYTSPAPPLMLLPEPFYERRLPRAKALVSAPGAVFNGQFEVDGERHLIDRWRGSQNHNWGSRHTDTYAWGQVAGFDDAPDVFLECTTARLKIGLLWTPPLTLVVLRIGADEYALNGLWQALRTRAEIDFFRWRIDARTSDVHITVDIQAPRSAFVGLAYANPPGGVKTCLNSKLAACSLILARRGQPPRTLHTEHGAAFEILTDRDDHGIPIVA